MLVLDQVDNVGNQFLAELRNIEVQNDRLRFKKNLARLGSIFAYEVSKSLSYQKQSVETPLGTKEIKLINSQPIVLVMLRAALPFYDGFIEFFDHADSGFIGSYRVENEDSPISVNYLYQAFPEIGGREVIILDPMLATGKSMVEAINKILEVGHPKKIHVVSIIAAPEGIEYIQSKIGIPVEIWVGSVDERLNDKSYIVPGLGDAGDLAFGPKIG